MPWYPDEKACSPTPAGRDTRRDKVIGLLIAAAVLAIPLAGCDRVYPSPDAVARFRYARSTQVRSTGGGFEAPAH